MRYELHNVDFLSNVHKLDDNSIDLAVVDPPYGLGKDFGNDSDKMNPDEFLYWTEEWFIKLLCKIKQSGSLFLFMTWRYAPEIFSMIKRHMIMVNEIIWDRRVPSMGGTTRRFTSVHDNIGFFVKSSDYYFDIDAVRVEYDKQTKKERSRPRFQGKKWLELGCNPKDVWSISRLHSQHRERLDHPTQKPLELIDRIVLSSSPEGGLVLDPFAGSGTTIESCLFNNRHCIAFEINSDYCDLIRNRVDSILL